MDRALRRDLGTGPLLGAWAGVASLAASRAAPGFSASAAAALAVPLALLPLAWWATAGASRWILAFLAAALLLPPLPLPGGDAGPHPAIVLAGLGLWAGLLRLKAWSIRLNLLSGALLVFFGTLLLSLPWAALYSGPQLALGSLLRVGLFGISVYLFFYLADGPGRELSAERLVRLWFWSGAGSAAFACLDFYFQFPAPARFAAQFVWLPQDVFRRAQGVFYEASTLGSICVFLLVMTASIVALRMGPRLRLSRAWLLAGAVLFLTALVLSFSRAAMLNLVVALVLLWWLARRGRRAARSKFRFGAAAIGCLAAGGAMVYWLVPDFLGAYLLRFWYSGQYLFSAPNLILSQRLESWRFLLGYLGEHPWQALFGIGYKTLPYSDVLGRPVIADNMYLSLLIETGWMGLAALLLLNLAVLRSCFRLAKTAGSDLQRLMGVWMFCFWAGLSVQMLSGDVLTYWRILPAFFAALAIGARSEDPLS